MDRQLTIINKLLRELEMIVWNADTDGASDSYGEVVLSKARRSRIIDVIQDTKKEMENE